MKELQLRNLIKVANKAIELKLKTDPDSSPAYQGVFYLGTDGKVHYSLPDGSISIEIDEDHVIIAVADLYGFIIDAIDDEINNLNENN